MAITRIAKGTAQTKSAGTTLTLSGVSMSAGDLLVVGVAYETDAGIVGVKWGKKDMNYINGSEATRGDTRVRFYRFKVKRNRTKNIVVTWAATMSARVLFATSLHEVNKKDIGVIATAGNSTAPATGSAGTSTVANTISIAAFASTGPSGDTAGTAGNGHTLGQRVGTTGGGAGSNVTLQETYEILSATGNIRSSLSGATQRNWAMSIVAFKASQTYTITSVYQAHRSMNENPDWVYFVIEDESGRGFTAKMHPDDFDDYTDQQVYDELSRYCSVHAENIIESEWNPVADAARDTKMATFVNDTIIL